MMRNPVRLVREVAGNLKNRIPLRSVSRRLREIQRADNLGKKIMALEALKDNLAEERGLFSSRDRQRVVLELARNYHASAKEGTTGTRMRDYVCAATHYTSAKKPQLAVDTIGELVEHLETLDGRLLQGYIDTYHFRDLNNIMGAIPGVTETYGERIAALKRKAAQY